MKKREKHKKTRLIPLSGRLYQCLADYLYKTKLEKESFLFPSNQSESGHLTRFAVNKFLSDYRNKLNIESLHPHALRHTCATMHLNAGANIVEIKQLLGHESIQTTSIYTHIPAEVLRQNIDLVTFEKKSFWQRILDFFDNRKDKIITVPETLNGLVVGRSQEIKDIISYVNRQINTILIGGVGVGKSHILENLKFTSEKVLILDDITSIKKSLINILVYLFENDKKAVFDMLYSDYDLNQLQTKLSRDSARNLCIEIKKLVEPKEYILQIDNIDRITPSVVKILEDLKDTFTILTSAREIPVNKSSFLWNFEVIRINELSRTDSLDLIRKLSYDLDTEDYELFRNHVYEQSNGNPRVIFELIDRYRKEPVITNEVIREIKHFGSLREIDMSLLVIISLASLAILRYLASETGNSSYRFIGGFAMILLIVSRQFFNGTKRKFI